MPETLSPSAWHQQCLKTMAKLLAASDSSGFGQRVAEVVKLANNESALYLVPVGYSGE
jgi:hypothetical protein